MTIHQYRPVAACWEWQQRASCRGMDSSVFFSPTGERGDARRARERLARAVCAGCEVRETCAATALRAGERFGLWGGLSEREREELQLRRSRSRAAESGMRRRA
ncbi:WhiB family transcriptional regulator [Streptacidiphilus anmyonensis]|uniref:WhiB family transcriptional regulator n=1 Tax=Streptacidiphilus anmyonensis TaxID=405782 RepID=UPI0005AA82A2|nr:WhiB family transcriptional regulator [Streptacidiphilus anmyonensis]